MKITKEELINYLNKGMSSRDIEKITGIKYWNIISYIKKYNLSEYSKYRKVEYDEAYFSKIDKEDKAYILGFMIANGCISNDDKFDLNIMLSDKEILDYIIKQIGGKVNTSNRTDKTKRIFPHCNIKIGNKKIIRNLKMLFGGRLKEERRLPIIKKDLELYMLQGFFDADGCITWGYRKDRNRLWHKISFTSQYKLLIGIQSILTKHGVTSALRPKSNKKYYVLEISSKSEVIKLLNLIYSDKNFIILKRKYKKATALRLELGEFGESLNG